MRLEKWLLATGPGPEGKKAPGETRGLARIFLLGCLPFELLSPMIPQLQTIFHRQTFFCNAGTIDSGNVLQDRIFALAAGIQASGGNSPKPVSW